MDKFEELYKSIAALKEAVETNNKPAADQAVQDVVKNAPKVSNRVTEFPVEEAGSLSTIHKMHSKDPRVVEFQKRADDVFIVSKLLGVDPRQTKLYKELQEPISELRKAMGTAVSGGGLEWIPTGFSSDLIEQIGLELKVAALHDRVSMPTDPFKIPLKTSFGTASLIGEGDTLSTSSDIGTAQVVLNAVKLMTLISFPYELEEDSIVAILPLAKKEIVDALARAQETATINGDTTNSPGHMDSDVSASTDARKAWNGYRKLAITAAKVDCGGTVIDLNKLREVRRSMGKYGVSPSKLAWIVGPSGYQQMLNLSSVLTLDKYGPQATVLSGELARIDGIPIIISEYIREDLNATGVYAAGANKTIAILVHIPAFIYGDRRTPLIEVDRTIKSQTTDVVSSQRIAFAPRYDATTEPIVGLLYNIKTVISP